MVRDRCLDMEVVAQLDAGDPITKKLLTARRSPFDPRSRSHEANAHALLTSAWDVVGQRRVDRQNLRARAHHAQEAGRAVLIGP